MGVRAPRHGHGKQQRETAATELDVNNRLKCLNILCRKGSASLEANSEAWASLKRPFSIAAESRVPADYRRCAW